MDIDRILHTKVEVNNDREKLTAYNLARGPSYSLNENLVPEQLFDNPETEEKEADGISAVKALSIAAQQGQTIYTITRENYSEVLPKLNHSDVVMTDIRNGINAGKTITIHDTEIKFNSWSGSGYTILDPNTGAGAYMIGGGLDGGWTATDSATLMTKAALATQGALNKSSELSRAYSWRLALDYKIGVLAKWLGALGFAVSTYSTVTNDSLSINSKIGRILTTFLAGVLVAMLAPVAGLFLTIALIAILTFINRLIYDYYFSARITLIRNQELYYV